MKDFLLFMLIPLGCFGLGAYFNHFMNRGLRHQLSESKDRLWDYEKDVARLTRDMEIRTDERRELQESCHTLEQEISRLAKERDMIEAKEEQARARTASENSKVKSLERDLNLAQQQATELKARAEAYDAARLRLSEVEDQASASSSALRAEENKSAMLAEENRRQLSLVAKLQEELAESVTLRRKLRESELECQRLEASLRIATATLAERDKEIARSTRLDPNALHGALQAVRARWEDPALASGLGTNGHEQILAQTPSTHRHW